MTNFSCRFALLASLIGFTPISTMAESTVLSAVNVAGLSTTAVSTTANTKLSIDDHILNALEKTYLTSEHVEPIYNAAILKHGGIEKVIQKISNTKNKQSKRKKANASLIVSYIYWRHGDLEQAMKAAEKAVKLESFSSTLMQKRRKLLLGKLLKKLR